MNMTPDNPNTPRVIVQDGEWRVPPDQRPHGWESMNICAPSNEPRVPTKPQRKRRRQFMKRLKRLQNGKAVRNTPYQQYLRSAKWRDFRKVVIADRNGR